MTPRRGKKRVVHRFKPIGMAAYLMVSLANDNSSGVIRNGTGRQSLCAEHDKAHYCEFDSRTPTQFERRMYRKRRNVCRQEGGW